MKAQIKCTPYQTSRLPRERNLHLRGLDLYSQAPKVTLATPSAAGELAELQRTVKTQAEQLDVQKEEIQKLWDRLSDLERQIRHQGDRRQ